MRCQVRHRTPDVTARLEASVWLEGSNSCVVKESLRECILLCTQPLNNAMLYTRLFRFSWRYCFLSRVCCLSFKVFMSLRFAVGIAWYLTLLTSGPTHCFFNTTLILTSCLRLILPNDMLHLGLLLNISYGLCILACLSRHCWVDHTNRRPVELRI